MSCLSDRAKWAEARAALRAPRPKMVSSASVAMYGICSLAVGLTMPKTTYLLGSSTWRPPDHHLLTALTRVRNLKSRIVTSNLLSWVTTGLFISQHALNRWYLRLCYSRPSTPLQATLVHGFRREVEGTDVRDFSTSVFSNYHSNTTIWHANKLNGRVSLTDIVPSCPPMGKPHLTTKVFRQASTVQPQKAMACLPSEP